MKRFVLALMPFLIVACSDSEESNSSQEKGQFIAQESFKALSGELQSAVARGGLEEALNYCKLNALPLTDSLASFHNASIKRTSLRFRNIENKPDSLELAVMVDYSEDLKLGIQPKPRVIEDANHARFFAPIPTKAFCLNCHGVPGKDISEEINMQLTELYPEDNATGFAEGDLRGIWSITFNK